MSMVLYACIQALFIYMAVYDIKRKEVPTKALVYMAIVGVVLSLCEDRIALYERMIGVGIGAIPLAIMMRIKAHSVGGGDALLLGVLGFIMGVEGVLFITLIGYTLAGISCILYIPLKKLRRTTKVAMFPFFYIAMNVYFIYAPTLHTFFRLEVV